MKKIFLDDFEKWRKLNKKNKFSLFDYIFHAVQSKEVSSDIIFACLELFWPSYVSQGKYVFLKDNVSAEKIQNLINEKQHVEYWANLFLVDPYFENEKDSENKSEFLAKSLKKIWEAKLSQDFPNKRFIVEYIHDSDSGDCGLTFYQK